MKILITGAGGQLGYDLMRVLGKAHECKGYARSELDITDEAAVNAVVSKEQPDVIVHAAAYTKVDLAETEKEKAYLVNADGTRIIALAAEAVQAKLVYISTDYVFDGTKGEPYNEGDRTHPLSVYGNSKLHGEKFVQMISSQYFIVRTSWLYGKTGDNFVTKILSLAERHQELQVVNDQIGSPTYTYDLAVCVGHLLQTDRYGIYHVANRGHCSRDQFAREILAAAGCTGVTVKPVSSEQFVTPAVRPANSAFMDRGLRRNGLPLMRDWKSALYDFMKNDWEGNLNLKKEEKQP